MHFQWEKQKNSVHFATRGIALLWSFFHLSCSQGRINHWANQANAWGFTLLGASRLNVKTFLLLDFHVFSLFTMCQNCRAFLLLRLVYRLRKLTTFALIVFEWLKRIEPNSTTFYEPRIRSKSVHPWVSAEIFPMKTTFTFCLSFSGY